MTTTTVSVCSEVGGFDAPVRVGAGLGLGGRSVSQRQQGVAVFPTEGSEAGATLTVSHTVMEPNEAPSDWSVARLLALAKRN